MNGVDHRPWFGDTTRSRQQALVAEQRMPVMHCYPYWTGAVKYGGAMDPPSVKLLAAMAALIRSYAGTQQKPVWAGEFNTCIKELTDEQQAEWLEKAVHAAIEQGVSWFSYWDSHDVDRKFDFNPLEYTLGPADQRWPREAGGACLQTARRNLSGQAGRISDGGIAAAAQPEDARGYVAVDSGLAGLEGEGVGAGGGSEFCGKTSVLRSGFLG